jgi:hypothetical protein
MPCRSVTARARRSSRRCPCRGSGTLARARRAGGRGWCMRRSGPAALHRRDAHERLGPGPCTMSPIAKRSGWLGAVRSGATCRRAARSTSARAASAISFASGDCRRLNRRTQRRLTRQPRVNATALQHGGAACSGEVGVKGELIPVQTSRAMSPSEAPVPAAGRDPSRDSASPTGATASSTTSAPSTGHTALWRVPAVRRRRSVIVTSSTRLSAHRRAR